MHADKKKIYFLLKRYNIFHIHMRRSMRSQVKNQMRAVNINALSDAICIYFMYIPYELMTSTYIMNIKLEKKLYTNSYFKNRIKCMSHLVMGSFFNFFLFVVIFVSNKS